MKNNLKIFILFLLCLSVIMVFCSCKVERTNDNTVLPEISIKDNRSNPISNYKISEKMNDLKYITDGDTIRYVNYGQEKVTLEFMLGDETLDNNMLKVNDKTIDLRFVSITYLQIIDDIIILTANVTDIYSTYLYAFNMDGNKILEIHNLDDNSMCISDVYDEDGSFQITNDKIIISGSRLYHGTSLNHGGSYIELKNIDDQWIDDISDDEIVWAKYELPYLGNGEFGTLNKIETTMTYGQLKNESVYCLSETKSMFETIETVDSETMKITIDGIKRTLYLYENISSDAYGINEEYYSIAILTNAITESTPPTLVKENDVFLGWKATKINNSYFCSDDGSMYFGYNTDVQFEGEVTVNAKIYYQNGEYFNVLSLVNNEYQMLFPEIIGIDKNKDRKLGFYNEDKVIELLGNKKGLYECEIKIKNFHLYYVPSEVINMATLIDLNILSVIEYYTE